MSDRLPIVVRGTGMYVPERVVDNQHFADYLDTSDEWITARTGIRERRWAAADECTSTLSAKASELALQNADMSIDEIDLILCATATGDCQIPATACIIQAAIGGNAREIPSLDISAACAGFVCGQIVASGLIATGMYRNVLLVGAETLSRYCNAEDRGTCILFGDGAGAAVLSPTSDTDRGVLYAEMGSDGTRTDHIWMPAGGSRLPASEATVAERLHSLRMRGREVYKFAVVKMQALIDRALSAAGYTAADLTLLIPHQSNLRIIESVRARMDLPADKVAINIDRYGNTSAASVIMLLDEARRSGKVQTGDLVLMVAIGAGLTWAVVLVRL